VTQVLVVHPTHPQLRLLKLAVAELRAGGLVVYPTDTTYAIACHMGDKAALERIIALRRLHKHHQFTLACRDLSELGTYARVDNVAYRLLKRLTPGPYTFVLKATREVPKRLLHAKRRTIGIRVPDHPVAQGLLEAMGEPLMTTTLRLPQAEMPWTDAADIHEALGSQVDIILDSGPCGTESSTVVDLTDSVPRVLREGAGVIDFDANIDGSWVRRESQN
jgi:tRNA threonylcarbamoyl adenosine modification protein (Sua5/YciO/YrdC/YwlC family)